MLVLDAVSVGYGPVPVLREVSLHVGEGEMVCLLGANGAGKSTTVRTISGLLRPTSGAITFLGERLDGRPAHAVLKRGIAQCPEGRRIFPEMTVRENLEMGAYVRGRAGASPDELERIFRHFPRLQERAGQLGGTLSGGEQQMLAIARALMSNPRLLLLDEPSLGLAPTMVETVFRVIDEIRRQGVTVAAPTSAADGRRAARRPGRSGARDPVDQGSRPGHGVSGHHELFRPGLAE